MRQVVMKFHKCDSSRNLPCLFVVAVIAKVLNFVIDMPPYRELLHAWSRNRSFNLVPWLPTGSLNVFLSNFMSCSKS